MNIDCPSRLPALAGAILALSLGLPYGLSAQGFDSLSTTRTIAGDLISDFPVDRALDGLSFQPGVTTNSRGELLLRGGQPQDAALYLDGVSILSGFRSTSFFGLSLSQALESSASIAPQLVDSVAAITGPLPSFMGNGQAGVISIRTRQAVSRTAAELKVESDEFFGSGQGFGLNRVLGRLEGRLGQRLSFLASGLLEGQRSVERGFNSANAPIFVQVGIDTTVAVPTSFNDPTADTTRVDVYDLAVSRGDCADFESSANRDIASNFGLGCDGIRTPTSAISTYELAGKLTYSLGGGRISLLALADQHQNRNFDYGMLYNPPGATGNRTTSSIYILGWQQALNHSPDRPLALDAHLSFQADRDRSGPLSPEGERSTRDPFGGFLISPLDLRFDFDNFPVDDQLVRNYRTNQPGSRRSPYDLENPAQYSLIDRYRNNAYGLYNRDPIAPVAFFDAGGPVGLLTLYQEKRSIGSAIVNWQPAASQHLQFGGEFARYSISNYSHYLEAQTFSDVSIEHPIRGALFLQDRIDIDGASINAGLRYDFYNTRARRPADFPRISSHPLYEPADPEAFFTSDELFPRDQGHDYLSPRIQLSFPAARRTLVRGSFATQAQVPNFRLSLLRVNTDISISDPTRTVFGSDLDFERTTMFEVGVRQGLTQDLSLDLAFYSRNLHSQVQTRLLSRFDPLRNNNQNLLLLTNDGSERVRGLEAKLDARMGTALSGWLGYSYQDASSEQPTAIGQTTAVPTLNNRPHSVAGALVLSIPGDWKRGSVVGGIFGNVDVYTLFRLASGTPYTPCSAGIAVDNSVLSPDLCSNFTASTLNAARLPTFKQLDLRLTKRFGPGGHFTGYVDARNLLNFKNVLAVFAVNGETSNAVELAENWVSDSLDLSTEATANAAYGLGGVITLGQGLPDPRVRCATWSDAQGNPAAPNCVYLIRAEERFGNGDHVFDVAEQRRASDALYRTVRGEQELTGPPRQVRLGLELGF
jgi:hypothetical protein